MRNRIVESVLTALLLGILGAAWTTFNEVKQLRFETNEIGKDLKELRGDCDARWGNVNDFMQEHVDAPKKKAKR